MPLLGSGHSRERDRLGLGCEDLLAVAAVPVHGPVRERDYGGAHVAGADSALLPRGQR